MLKNFSDFRDNWLTPEKLSEMQSFAEKQAERFKGTDDTSYMATFSANYSLQLLDEYHEWILSQKGQL